MIFILKSAFATKRVVYYVTFAKKSITDYFWIKYDCVSL